MEREPHPELARKVLDEISRREFDKTLQASLARRRQEQVVRILPKTEEREPADAERQREGIK